MSGRHSPFPIDSRDVSPRISETLIEQPSSSTATDDSPDHQVLMVPRNTARLPVKQKASFQQVSPKIEIENTETVSEDYSIDAKKDI